MKTQEMKRQETKAQGEFELVRGDPRYPSRLEGVSGIGDRLYGIGDVSLLSRPCLSVIGARQATPYGLSAARMAGEVAARAGIVVVSGGARGCDQAASMACINAGGKTIVCAGCGADRTYPRSSSELFERARSGEGCVVALEKWGAPPRKYAFPKRNLVIAALSRSLIVVEAGIPSGTMSTATAAAELGRNVYAVPGSIYSPTSAGANRLIESGAAIICDEVSLQMNISMDYGFLMSPECLDCHDDEPVEHNELVRFLQASPQLPADLSHALGEDLRLLLRDLANLEAEGIVQRLSDGRYSLSEAALLKNFGRIQGRL